MASAWSSWSTYPSNSYMKVRCHVSASISKETDTQVWIKVSGYATGSQCTQFGVSLTLGCGGSTHAGATGVINYGDTVASCSYTFGPYNKADSAKSRSCTVKLTGATVNGYGKWTGSSVTATCSVTIPKLVYKTPAAPSGLKLTRVSDTSVKISWTNNPDASNLKPYTGLTVQRSVGSGGGDQGGWSTVVSLGSTTSSYTSSGLSANSRYRYRVRATNSAGSSSWVTSSYVYTKPSAPKTVTATKTSTTTATVTADVSNSYPATVWVDRKVGDGDWDYLADAGLSGATATYTDGDIPSSPSVQYRMGVRVYQLTATSSTILKSGNTTSNELKLAVAPNAPTVTGPTGTLAAGTTATWTWTPNHPDGSAQTAAQVELVNQSGATSTTDITGATTTWTRDGSLNTPGTIKLRIRTKGLHEDWGAWSAYTTLTFAYPPQASLILPDLVEALPFTIEWDITDTTGVSQQRLTITQDDATILDRTPQNNTRTLTVTSSDCIPANGTITVTLTVRGGSGLETTTTASTQVGYVPPGPPLASVGVDQTDCSCHITVEYTRLTPGAYDDQEYWTRWEDEGNNSTSLLADFYTVWEGDENNSTSVLATLDEGAWRPPTHHATIQRVDPDGTITTIADQVGDGDEIIDRLPPLNCDLTYIITALTETGSAASTEVSIRVETGAVALNFGTAAEDALLITTSFTLSDNPTPTIETYHFADGSDTGLPHAYRTGDIDNSSTLSTTYSGDSDDWTTYRRIRRLARQQAFAWVRSPAGDRMRAVTSIGQELHADGLTVDLTVDMTEIAWEEPYG